MTPKIIGGGRNCCTDGSRSIGTGFTKALVNLCFSNDGNSYNPDICRTQTGYVLSYTIERCIIHILQSDRNQIF